MSPGYLDRKTSKKQWLESRLRLLTFHAHFHILEKTVNDFKCPRRGDPSLILDELIQPPHVRLEEVILSLKLLCDFHCMTISRVVCRRGRTYLIGFAWSI